MKVTRLEVKRQESYEQDAGQFKGIVTLTGDTGQQTIVLSNSALSRIFGVIAAEVQDTARRNAEQVKRGMQDAADSPLLLEKAEISNA